MNFVFRLFLTFNATSLIIVIFLVKTRFVLSKLSTFFTNFPDFFSYVLYFSIPLLLTLLSLYLANFLNSDSIESNNKTPAIIEIEQANNVFLPSYLGYFFVALSVPYIDTLIFVFAILFLFTFLSQSLYFNPLFLIFRYNFYYLTTSTNIKIFLISKRRFKNPNTVSLSNLKRINDFTFIDREGL